MSTYVHTIIIMPQLLIVNGQLKRDLEFGIWGSEKELAFY